VVGPLVARVTGFWNRIGRPWLATVANTFVDPRVLQAPGRPQAGRPLPGQDLRHRATAGPGVRRTGRQYLVGRAGVDTVGAPRTLQLGLRYGPGH
jgi:hypothetical protein